MAFLPSCVCLLLPNLAVQCDPRQADNLRFIPSTSYRCRIVQNTQHGTQPTAHLHNTQHRNTSPNSSHLLCAHVYMPPPPSCSLPATVRTHSISPRPPAQHPPTLTSTHTSVQPAVQMLKHESTRPFLLHIRPRPGPQAQQPHTLLAHMHGCMHTQAHVHQQSPAGSTQHSSTLGLDSSQPLAFFSARPFIL